MLESERFPGALGYGLGEDIFGSWCVEASLVDSSHPKRVGVLRT